MRGYGESDKPAGVENYTMEKLDNDLKVSLNSLLCRFRLQWWIQRVQARITKICKILLIQGGHGTGKTGNLAVNFSRQGKHREFSKFNFLHRENCGNTGKILKI